MIIKLQRNFLLRDSKLRSPLNIRERIEKVSKFSNDFQPSTLAILNSNLSRDQGAMTLLPHILRFGYFPGSNSTNSELLIQLKRFSYHDVSARAPLLDESDGNSYISCARDRLKGSIVFKATYHERQADNCDLPSSLRLSLYVSLSSNLAVANCLFDSC